MFLPGSLTHPNPTGPQPRQSCSLQPWHNHSTFPEPEPVGSQRPTRVAADDERFLCSPPHYIVTLVTTALVHHGRVLVLRVRLSRFLLRRLRSPSLLASAPFAQSRPFFSLVKTRRARCCSTSTVGASSAGGKTCALRSAKSGSRYCTATTTASARLECCV